MASEEPTRRMSRSLSISANLPSEASVATIVAEALVSAGVTHVFGGHGGTIIPLIAAICKHPNLTWVYMRNENNASLAAAAMAKLTDSLACCIATSGPGASNLTTGLIDAAIDRVPVLALTGLRARWDVGHTEFQDIDQTALFHAAGVSFSKSVIHSQEAVPLLRNAIRHAIDFHTVAHLAIPVDILAKSVSIPPTLPTFQIEQLPTIGSPFTSIPHSRAVGFPSESELDAAAKVLEGPTKRIVICVGPRAAMAAAGEGCGSSILHLAEVLNAPIVTTLDAKGVVDERHPLCFGVLGIFGNPGLEVARSILTSADLLVLFGVTLAADFVLGANKLQSRMVVSIADDHGSALLTHWVQCETRLTGNMTRIADALATRLSHGNTVADSAPHPSNHAACCADHCPQMSSYWQFVKNGEWRHGPKSPVLRAKDAPVHQHESKEGYCHPGAVLDSLSHRLRSEDVVTVDTGDITLWTSLYLRIINGTRVLSSQGMGTMGYSVPAGLAAALHRPDPFSGKVVIIAGDGGVQMTINELSVAQQLKLTNVILIISNNSLLGRIHFGFDTVYGDELVSPDYVQLARAYGGDGVKIDNPLDVEKVLDQAFAFSTGVFVIEMIVDPQLKATMAKAIDTSRFDRIARRYAHKLWPGDMLRIQEALGVDNLSLDMMSSEELTSVESILKSVFSDKEAAEYLISAIHAGDLTVQTIKPLLPPSTESALEITKKKETVGTVLADIGCVMNVLNGVVPQELLKHPLKAADFRCGFELGAIDTPNPESLSDMIMVNGNGYIQCTDAKSKLFTKLVSGPTVFSIGAVLLPKTVQPDYLIQSHSSEQPIEWNRVQNDVYAHLHSPYFFSGLVTFDELSGQAITRPPIFGEALLSNVGKYYNGATETMVNGRQAFVCGICVRYGNLAPELNRDLQRHLYDVKQFEQMVQASASNNSDAPEPEATTLAPPRGATTPMSRTSSGLLRTSSSIATASSLGGNPLRRIVNAISRTNEQFSQAVLTHTHGLVLRPPVHSIEEIQPENVERVVHLRGNSRCTNLELEIYCIQKIEPVAH